MARCKKNIIGVMFQMAGAMVNLVSLWPLGWPFGPTPHSKVTVASVGRPCFAPPHPLCVQCGKAGEAPGMLCEKPHNEADTAQSFADHSHSLKQVEFS